jgi:trehalose/maltose hydrolase-like predicted phosphorylase
VDRSFGAFAQTDPWLLTTTDPNANRGNHGIFLGNGYLGATFGANGGAGKDSVCYVAGVYDAKENLLRLPNWHDLGLPAPKSGDKYEQTLDMKRGVLTTKMGGVTITAFASAADPHIAVLHVDGASLPASAKKGDAIADTPLWIAVREVSEPNGNGWTRFVEIQPAARSASSIDGLNYEGARAAHEAAWSKLWQEADIQIDGDTEAQQLIHKLMFDLLQSAPSWSEPPGKFYPFYSLLLGTSNSIPPETWSGDFYKGHIFWDAEVWMFPALLAQYPDRARTVLDYRYRHLPEARALAKKEGCAGVSFPWESAASGNEVAPGFVNERHITADVGWAAWQYYLATQDKAWLKERGWPLLSGIADYWASRAKKNPATGKYDVRGVVGPDELKGTVDNNTYTNALAGYCLLAANEAARVIGQPAKPQWAIVAKNLALPFDKAKNRYLARENDTGEKTKQADGELLLYPAELPMDRKTAEATFDFHAARPIKNGPAMTTSIHALIAARLGRADQAEKSFRESYRPFVRGPFLLFSEKRSLDRCVFTTGAGGVLQSVLYGFGGLDWRDWDRIATRPVTLPPTWKRLTITGIRRAGKRYTLTVTPQQRTLTRTP